MQIPELLGQLKFVSAGCHAHFNDARILILINLMDFYGDISEVVKDRALGFQIYIP